MFKQLCKQRFPIILFPQPIFTSKTYKHEVTYNHASAGGNLQLFNSLPEKKKHLRKVDVRSQVKQELEEIRF